MLALIQQMPVPPMPDIEERFDPTKVPCVCGKYVLIQDCKVAWSGFTHYVVALCPDHLKDLRDMSRVVCPRCKTLVMLLDPHEEANGFVFAKGGTYHVEACPICSPGLKKSAIAEKIIFYKQRKVPYCNGDTIIS